MNITFNLANITIEQAREYRNVLSLLDQVIVNVINDSIDDKTYLVDTEKIAATFKDMNSFKGGSYPNTFSQNDENIPLTAKYEDHIHHFESGEFQSHSDSLGMTAEEIEVYMTYHFSRPTNRL